MTLACHPASIGSGPEVRPGLCPGSARAAGPLEDSRALGLNFLVLGSFLRFR